MRSLRTWPDGLLHVSDATHTTYLYLSSPQSLSLLLPFPLFLSPPSSTIHSTSEGQIVVTTPRASPVIKLMTWTCN